MKKHFDRWSCTIEARICCVWVTFNVRWLCKNFMIEEQHTRIFRWVPFRRTFRQKSQLKNFSLSIGEISPSFRYFAHSTKKQEYALFHTIWEMLWIPRWWTVSHCRKRSFSGNPNLTKISVRASMTSREVISLGCTLPDKTNNNQCRSIWTFR